jgi:deoxyribonuclease-4
MPHLGAHLSINGGLPRAVARAIASGCDALQIFTKSVGQWRARPLEDDEVRAFRDAVTAAGLKAVAAHASYLINIASERSDLRATSMTALGDEIDRAERLGLLGLVLHPGSGTEADGLPRIADGLSRLLAARPDGQTLVLLEHTAGQGTNLGHRFEHLRAILDLMPDTTRVGVCLDTCHLLAAGYDLSTEDGYRDTFEQFERIVGLPRLKLFHLNDSKKPPGSRVDRHEHIGAGFVGLAGFARLLNDARFAALPMVIETAKADTKGTLAVDPHDARNLAALRALLREDGKRAPILR